jgi:hypothetical protein
MAAAARVNHFRAECGRAKEAAVTDKAASDAALEYQKKLHEAELDAAKTRHALELQQMQTASAEQNSKLSLAAEAKRLKEVHEEREKASAAKMKILELQNAAMEARLREVQSVATMRQTSQDQTTADLLGAVVGGGVHPNTGYLHGYLSPPQYHQENGDIAHTSARRRVHPGHASPPYDRRWGRQSGPGSAHESGWRTTDHGDHDLWAREVIGASGPPSILPSTAMDPASSSDYRLPDLADLYQTW